MIFLADLPPPIHGMSSINLAFCDVLKKAAQGKVVVINTSPSIPGKYFNTYFWILAKIGMIPMLTVKLIKGFTNSQHSTLYRAINGGAGQVFDIIYLAVARIFGIKIFIHHHSCNSISKKKLLFSLLNKVAGKDAIHIVLGMEMKLGLCNKYQILDSSIRIQSNLAFFDSMPKISKSTEFSNQVLRIGHLSNLCEEKGLGVFIELCAILESREVEFEAVLAGPFVNKVAEQLYKQSDCNINYLGPLYGESKQDFYQSIDLFVFPSMYFNEAEPLVLYEAAQYGVFLIGTKRGCMPSVISSFEGQVVCENKEISEVIAEKISKLVYSDELQEHSMVLRQNLFNVKIRDEKKNLVALVGEILNV